MLQLSVQTGGFFKESSPAEGMAFLSRCGIEAVDYNINDLIPVRDIFKGARAELFDLPLEEFLAYFAPLKEQAAKNGIAFAQMHGPFPIWMEGQDEANDYLLYLTERCLDAAAYLGCPALVVHPVTLPGRKKEEIELNFTLYRKLIPAAKRTGVKICLENMFYRKSSHLIGGSCADVREVVNYIDTLNAEAGAELFGYCFDIGHANLTARSILEDIRVLGNRLTVLHIHDNNGADDLHLMPYSQAAKGAVDWEEFVTGLRETGYRGDLSFETFMVMRTFPQPLWPEVLSLITAEGRLFRDRILAE